MKWLGQIAVLLLAAARLYAVTDTVTNAPLPDLDKVVQGVIDQANRENDADKTFRQHYSYTRTRVTEYRNSSGDLKSRQEKTSDKHPRTNVVARVRAPVTPKPDADDKKDAAFDRKDFVLTHDLVDRFDIEMVGREMVRGRPALVATFKPKDMKLPENSIKDKFINHAAGKLWIDEADFALVKADVHLTQQVNVFGGVAGAIWKFNCNLERGRTDDGLWYVLSMNWHAEGREIIFSRYINYHELWTNVRKTQ